MSRRKKVEPEIYDGCCDNEYSDMKWVPESEVSQPPRFDYDDQPPLKPRGYQPNYMNNGLEDARQAFYGDFRPEPSFQRVPRTHQNWNPPSHSNRYPPFRQDQAYHHGPQHTFDRETPSFITDFTVEPRELKDIYNEASVLRGLIVTNLMEKSAAFAVMTHDKKLYMIPRTLIQPPPNQKLNFIQKWEKRFELKFGHEISFVLNEDGRTVANYRVTCPYSKDKSESAFGKAIPMLRVSCVISPKNWPSFNDDVCVFTDKFDLIPISEEYKPAEPNVAYDAFIGFTPTMENGDFTVKISFEKIIGLCDSQSFVLSAPWNQGIEKMHSIDQGEVTENEEHLEIIGEKLAFRFSMRQVLLLGNPDNMKPLLLPYKSEDSDRCPIGSICRIDYMKHALTSDYLVRSMTMDSEFSTPLDKNVLTSNQKRSFIFTINLPIDTHWLGFYYHYPLGVVADSQGLLGFLPYSEERVDDVVEVNVIVTLDSPCLFDIYDLTEETANLVRQCKPKKLVADGLLKSCDTGALISPKYPRLKLCLHPELKRRFEPGSILKTEFYPDEDGQRFISSNDEGLLSRISPEENVCLVTKENNEEYCLFLLAVSKVEVTEKLSKKTQKKKRIEQLEPPKFSDFEKHFCNFLYRPTGIISTTTNRRFKELNNKMTNYAILELNLEPGSQTDFNFVGFFDKTKDKFSFENPMIEQQLKKVFSKPKEEKIVNVDDTMSIKSFNGGLRTESRNSLTSGRTSRNQMMKNNVFSPLQFDDMLSNVVQCSLRIPNDFDDKSSMHSGTGSVSNQIPTRRNLMNNYERRSDSENGEFYRRQIPNSFSANLQPSRMPNRFSVEPPPGFGTTRTVRSPGSTISTSSGFSTQSTRRLTTTTPHFLHNSWLYKVEIDLNDRNIQRGLSLFSRLMKGERLNLNLAEVLQN